MKFVKRGQESAPIELLIGVTILTFVLIIGFYIISQSSSQEYEQKLKASFSNFARDLESVYLGGVGTSLRVNIDFSAPSAGDNFAISFIKLTQGVPSTCERQVGRNDCLELYAFKRDKQGNNGLFLAEVINIPSSVSVKATFGNCQNVNLSNSNIPDPNNLLPNDCDFSPTVHSFILTKEDSNTINITEG